nr:protein dopey [Quercus suber]
MNLEPRAVLRSASPTRSSGRSTPVPRESRRAVEDGLIKADKNLRRYGATIERALQSWEASPQEWADYIAFLTRLSKVRSLTSFHHITQATTDLQNRLFKLIPEMQRSYRMAQWSLQSWHNVWTQPCPRAFTKRHWKSMPTFSQRSV